MSYNRDNYARVRREFEEKRNAAQDKAERTLARLHEEYPDLAEIDRTLAKTGMKLFKTAATTPRDKLDDAVAIIKSENQELQHARAECLKYHGLPADITDVKYECKLCLDTGYVGTSVCKCFKKALILAGYESSGIGNLIKTQTFSTFDLSYYSDDKKAAENMGLVFACCKKYAEKFNTDNPDSLLFIGPTGLGKTHLSSAIAKRVIDRGFDVVYETAQNIFGDFEYERFVRSYSDDSEAKTRKYFECDLLIIDDLGTEVTNQFTVACLYNIINTRLNRGLSAIINTNLPKDELRRRYADRITSRLFGEFRPLMFMGHDIRERRMQ